MRVRQASWWLLSAFEWLVCKIRQQNDSKHASFADFALSLTLTAMLLPLHRDPLHRRFDGSRLLVFAG